MLRPVCKFVSSHSTSKITDEDLRRGRGSVVCKDRGRVRSQPSVTYISQLKCLLRPLLWE